MQATHKATPVNEAYKTGGIHQARQLILDTYDKEGSLEKSAASLGMSQGTLSYWLNKLRIIPVTTLIVEGQSVTVEETFYPIPEPANG